MQLRVLCYSIYKNIWPLVTTKHLRLDAIRDGKMLLIQKIQWHHHASFILYSPKQFCLGSGVVCHRTMKIQMLASKIGDPRSHKTKWPRTILIQRMRWDLYHHMSQSVVFCLAYLVSKYLVIQWGHMRVIVLQTISYIYIYRRDKSHTHSSWCEQMIQTHTGGGFAVSASDTYAPQWFSRLTKSSPRQSRLGEHIPSIDPVSPDPMFVHTSTVCISLLSSRVFWSFFNKSHKKKTSHTYCIWGDLRRFLEKIWLLSFTF